MFLWQFGCCQLLRETFLIITITWKIYILASTWFHRCKYTSIKREFHALSNRLYMHILSYLVRKQFKSYMKKDRVKNDPYQKNRLVTCINLLHKIFQKLMLKQLIVPFYVSINLWKFGWVQSNRLKSIPFWNFHCTVTTRSIWMELKFWIHKTLIE